MTNVISASSSADDESIIRLDLKEILEGDGYLVVGEAARGDDALAMIRDSVRLGPARREDAGPRRHRGRHGAEGDRHGGRLAHGVQPAFAHRERRDAGVVAYSSKPFRSSEILPKLAAIMSPANEERDAEVSQVEDKIETREIVQRAKEMLMQERGLDEPAAFEIIQQSAMRGRTRMRDIAQQILKGEFVG